ncbi:MAG: ribosomal L7Ae/L30e/S12e/Gadd45 family protein [Syntrophomonadaceae bacterium]|nr:ribosomal L7Ae/L30e/S12e/Gadd45 family protein [Syntrophomonadaceae bacterium]
MALEELKSGARVIGTRQVKKALNKGIVKKVYIASDAEPHIIEPIKQLCQQNQVEIEVVDKMVTLGDICGIEVGSATAALLNE